MASSISRPMASERAIRVMTLRVIPRAFMMMKTEMTEIGRVRPVITVERQELMKQKTIRMVRIPPMIRVSCTSASDSRVMIEPSRTRVRVTPRGKLGLKRRDHLFDLVDQLHDVGPRLLVDVEADGRDAVDQREAALLLDPVGDLGDLARAGSAGPTSPPPPSSGILRPERLCPRSASDIPSPCRSGGRGGCSCFRERKPGDDSFDAQPERLEPGRIDDDVDLALRRPTRSTLPTPATLSNRLLIFFSARMVSSRGERVADCTAREATGRALKSNFWMIGSSIPFGSWPRMAPILARASWVSSLIFSSRRNSTRPSKRPRARTSRHA